MESVRTEGSLATVKYNGTTGADTIDYSALILSAQGAAEFGYLHSALQVHW